MIKVEPGKSYAETIANSNYWEEKAIELEHQLTIARRTIAGLEYALYYCIPYHDRAPKREE